MRFYVLCTKAAKHVIEVRGGGAWRNGLNVKGLLNTLYVWSKEGIGLIYKEFKNPKKTKIADESTWVSNET